MKILCSTVLILFGASVLFAGTPTLDGIFDGTEIWGAAVSTADGVAGWNGANAKKLYVTYDDTWYYFGAEVTAEDWYQWAFVINWTSGGGTSDPWSRSINYGHSNLPDVVLVGHFGDPSDNGSNTPYGEIRKWNSLFSRWDAADAPWSFAEDETQFVEMRVIHDGIDWGTSLDVQFYLTGNANSHGTFDACPDDENADQWDESSSHTTLHYYQDDVSLPVELSVFTAQNTSRGVELIWATDSEVENQGFIISRKTDGARWTELASFSGIKALEGHGSTTQANRYSFTDTQVREGQTYSYMLSDVDYRGNRTNHERFVQEITRVNPEERVRPTVIELTSIYPNPFNPVTTLSYNLSEPSDVSVNIYSMIGELVWTYSQSNQAAGENYQLTWQGVDNQGKAVNSGIYLVSIEAGTHKLSEKVTLLR